MTTSGQLGDTKDDNEFFSSVLENSSECKILPSIGGNTTSDTNLAGGVANGPLKGGMARGMDGIEHFSFVSYSSDVQSSFLPYPVDSTEAEETSYAEVKKKNYRRREGRWRSLE